MYDAEDVAALLREHPHFVHGLTVQGPRLTMREATPDDAAFILSLRLDPEKNRHISPVTNDIEAQRRWIKEASRDPGQIYFIIESDKPVGTVRLYDQRGTSFSWGSWILSADAPKSAAVESTLMVYSLGLHLGFTGSHFEVRQGNKRVWEYHQRCGARMTAADGDDFHFYIDKGSILALLQRYKSRGEIRVG